MIMVTYMEIGSRKKKERRDNLWRYSKAVEPLGSISRYADKARGNLVKSKPLCFVPVAREYDALAVQ